MGETGSMSLSSSAAGDGLYLCWYTGNLCKKACLLMLWCEEVSISIYFTDEGTDKKKTSSTWILHTKHTSYIWWTQLSLPQI